MKNLIFSIFLSFSAFAIGQNIPNAKTVNVKISGNCGMCKQTIETAANKKGETILDWNSAKKVASLTYDSIRTTPQDVLKRVADAGYDNEFHQGNDDVYAKLHKCCLYDRNNHNQ